MFYYSPFLLLSSSANMLFKAALKETRAVEGDSTSGPPSSHQPVKDVPHPYLLALGVLSVQKVRVWYVCSSHMYIAQLVEVCNGLHIILLCWWFEALSSATCNNVWNLVVLKFIRRKPNGQKKVSVLERCHFELHARAVFGERKGVPIREVSSFQECP